VIKYLISERSLLKSNYSAISWLEHVIFLWCLDWVVLLHANSMKITCCGPIICSFFLVLLVNFTLALTLSSSWGLNIHKLLETNAMSFLFLEVYRTRIKNQIWNVQNVCSSTLNCQLATDLFSGYNFVTRVYGWILILNM
jgi:hypothetical protein